MKAISILIFPLLFVKPFSGYINSKELKISQALIKQLKIRHCVFVGSTERNHVISEIKTLATANVPVTIINYSQLSSFINENDRSPYKIGLILHDQLLHFLSEILKTLGKEEKGLKIERFTWLVFAPDFSTNIDESVKLNLRINSEFFVIQQENSNNYKLREYYSIKNESFTVDLGTWNTDFGLEMTKTALYTRRSNFRQIRITIVSREDAECSQKIIVCQAHEIMNGLGLIMNFTNYQNVTRPEEQILEKLNSFGDVADFIMPLQHDFTDKLGAIAKIPVNWYIKYPSTELRSDYYLQPYDTYLWIALLSTVFFATLLIIFIQNLIRDEKRNFADDLFLAIESFCNQCGNEYLEHVSIRIVTMLLRLIAILSIGSYGAIITSFIAVEIPRPPFTTLQGLMDNGQYKFAIAERNLLHDFLRESNSPVVKKILLNFTSYSNISSVDRYTQALMDVCNKKMAGFTLDNGIEMSDMPCLFYKMPEQITVMWLVLHLQSNSPFAKLFNKNFVRLYERGIQKRIYSILHGRHLKRKQEELFRPVKMDQMVQVLSIPFIGIILALPIIFVEMVTSRIKSRKTRARIGP